MSNPKFQVFQVSVSVEDQPGYVLHRTFESKDAAMEAMHATCRSIAALPLWDEGIYPEYLSYFDEYTNDFWEAQCVSIDVY